LLALSFSVAGCHSVQVRTVTDQHTDFTRFHTFNFAPPDISAAAPQLTETNRQRLQAAVIDEMAKRSCQVADEPDLLFRIGLETSAKSYDRSNPQVEGDSLGANLGTHYGLKYDKELGSQPEVKYTEGTLSFRVFDRKQDRQVWEGLVTGILYQNRPDEQVQKRIHEAVSSVFAEYPVKPTGK
jgi:hypothetical protein